MRQKQTRRDSQEIAILDSTQVSPRPAPVKKLAQTNPNALTEILAEIGTADLKRLRALWQRHLGSVPPSHKSPEVIAMLLAWQVQAQLLGGFDAWTARRLRELAAGFDRDPDYKPSASVTLRPGLVLTRDWRGVRHRVLVQSDGFLHQGKIYKSLTLVARAITGTAWSGPRFFGLGVKDKTRRGRRKVRPSS